MSACPVGCALGTDCRYAQLCADLLDPSWRRIPVGHLTETHIGRRLRIPLAGAPLPLEGALTGLWPFADDASLLRLHASTAAPRLHLVHDSVEVEVW